MARTSTVTLGAVGAFVAAVGVWNLHRRFTTAEVPYTVVDAADGVELRRYPPTVLAETVAPPNGRRSGGCSGTSPAPTGETRRRP